jgi:diaminopimelate decarboxylase
LKGAFAAVDTHIHYACKANNNLHILRIMHTLGAGLDTVSIYEVMLGLKAGFKPEQIVFTPNGVAMDEMTAAVDAGVHINIDNLSILEQFGENYGNTIPVCIRVNPHIMGGGNFNISTGHIDSKFGISIYQMRHVQRIVEHAYRKRYSRYGYFLKSRRYPFRAGRFVSGTKVSGFRIRIQSALCTE